MKTLLTVAVAFSLVASSAAAQGYVTFSPGKSPPTRPKASPSLADPYRPKTYAPPPRHAPYAPVGRIANPPAAPKAEPFKPYKPYEPFKPGSTYGRRP